MGNSEMNISNMVDGMCTPLFLLDADELAENVSRINKLCNKYDIKTLYAVKANSLIETLNVVGKEFFGFSVSSLFEARIVREELGGDYNIHYTSPMIKLDELRELTDLCDVINMNSIPQLQNFPINLEKNLDIGLRINPNISFVNDVRFDPCRDFSKLGVGIEEAKKNNVLMSKISGLHFHTNCESETFMPLCEIVEYMDVNIGDLLQKIEWVNLGGGYLFTSGPSCEYLKKLTKILRDKYRVEVFIEPGKGVIKNSGYLVSTVIDLFESDGKQIAILDTTINHAPEVFEYQFSPDVEGHIEHGEYEYILAGCSCLAGDLFGEYCFEEPLEIGSKIVFKDMAAYTLVKANMFNGINLPSIYKYTENGGVELLREYTYEDFRSRLGDKSDEALRKRNNYTDKEEPRRVISFSGG